MRRELGAGDQRERRIDLIAVCIGKPRDRVLKGGMLAPAFECETEVTDEHFADEDIELALHRWGGHGLHYFGRGVRFGRTVLGRSAKSSAVPVSSACGSALRSRPPF